MFPSGCSNRSRVIREHDTSIDHHFRSLAVRNRKMDFRKNFEIKQRSFLHEVDLSVFEDSE